MDEAGLTPADCRRLREQARVSLHELARQLHRDPSSLSRFERGQQVPRDVEAVITAYQALEPRAPPPETESQPLRTTTSRLRSPIMVLLVSRWVVLALAVPFGMALGASGSFAADSVRVFIIAGAALTLPFMLVLFRRLQNTGRRLIVVSWAIAIAFCGQTFVDRLGEPRLRVHNAACALAAVETGLIGLAWRHQQHPHE